MTGAPHFVFATGIENSYPTIEGGRVRVDEMEACGHYERWREDFALAQDDLGIHFLRYGQRSTAPGSGRAIRECRIATGSLRTSPSPS